MSRFFLDPKPELPGYSASVGYEKHLGSFFAHVYDAEGALIVAADGLATPITDPAKVLEAVRAYALIPDDIAAFLAAMPSVERTATDRARRR